VQVQRLVQRTEEARRAHAGCAAAPAVLARTFDIADHDELALEPGARMGAHDLEHVVLGLDARDEQGVALRGEPERAEDLRILGLLQVRAVLQHGNTRARRRRAGELGRHGRRIEHEPIGLAQGQALHAPQPRARERAPLPPAPLAPVHGDPHARPAAAREPQEAAGAVAEHQHDVEAPARAPERAEVVEERARRPRERHAHPLQANPAEIRWPTLLASVREHGDLEAARHQAGRELLREGLETPVSGRNPARSEQGDPRETRRAIVLHPRVCARRTRRV
jgi:hypothetical protein